MYKISKLASAREKEEMEARKKRPTEREAFRDSLNTTSTTIPGVSTVMRNASDAQGVNADTARTLTSNRCEEIGTTWLFDPLEEPKSSDSNSFGCCVKTPTMYGERTANLRYRRSKEFYNLLDRTIKPKTLPAATSYERPLTCSKNMNSQERTSSTLDSNQTSGDSFGGPSHGCTKFDQAHAQLRNTKEAKNIVNSSSIKPLEGEIVTQQPSKLSLSSSKRDEGKKDLNAGPSGVENRDSHEQSLRNALDFLAGMPRLHDPIKGRKSLYDKPSGRRVKSNIMFGGRNAYVGYIGSKEYLDSLDRVTKPTSRNIGNLSDIRGLDNPTGTPTACAIDSSNKDSEPYGIAPKAATFGFTLASWKQMCIDWFSKPLRQYDANGFHGWTCVKCHFINEPRKNHCVVCQTKNFN